MIPLLPNGTHVAWPGVEAHGDVHQRPTGRAIDLIVLATSGRGRVARLMMGSVADMIVRSAPCPVLTIHPHDRDEATEGGRAA